jgi:hypothetical protein
VARCGVCPVRKACKTGKKLVSPAVIARPRRGRSNLPL